MENWGQTLPWADTRIKHTFPYWEYKKSRIRETKHLSTDADSSTDTKKILLVGQNSPKKINKK